MPAGNTPASVQRQHVASVTLCLPKPPSAPFERYGHAYASCTCPQIKLSRWRSCPQRYHHACKQHAYTAAVAVCCHLVQLYRQGYPFMPTHGIISNRHMCHTVITCMPETVHKHAVPQGLVVADVDTMPTPRACNDLASAARYHRASGCQMLILSACKFYAHHWAGLHYSSS